VSNQKIPSKALSVIAFAFATILALFFLLVFVPKIISVLNGTARELPPGQQWEGHIMIAMFVVFMLGYIIGWWRPLWGGRMMIAAALLVSVPLSLQGNLGSLIFGIPQFAIGSLYVLLARMEMYKSA
jgi:hypothetical protein